MENLTAEQSVSLLDTTNSSNFTTSNDINEATLALPESCSILVKNLQSHPDLERTLAEFFSFCGTIAALSIVNDVNDETLVTALVTFNESSSAKTAVLLTNTQINDRNVTIELVEPQPNLINTSFQAPVLQPKGTVEVVLNIGNEIAENAIVAARSIDEKIHVTETIGNVVLGIEDGVKSIDKEYHVSEMGAELVNNITDKAVEIDSTYHISDQAAVIGESIKGSLLQLEHNHQITQRMNEASGVVVAGVGSGVQQISEFLNTNETAKTGLEFVSDVSVSLGSAINGFWSSLTQPTQPAPVNHPSPQIQITTSTTNTI